MKVYVLRGGYDHGDGDVLLTFTNKEKAEKALEFMLFYGKYNWHRIEESEVDEVEL